MIKAIVTDIEGTTSSLSFVKDVLFPYARRHLPDYARAHQHEAAVATCLDQVRVLVGQSELSLDEVIAQLIDWIDADKKITPLKALQGLIWEKGYRDGDFHGHIYADAMQCLREWHAQGIALYVYSSGSVYAQKLLFAHTPFGDLTPLFSGYFDTTIGAKVETASYRAILDKIDVQAEQVLFLSDSPPELDAARRAGLATYALRREPSVPVASTHRQAEDFNQIAF